MIQILPGIIAETRDELAQQLDSVRGHAPWAQVDVMDGIFAPRKSWPYSAGEISDLAKLKGSLKVEVHLMISKPETVLSEWIASGADRILVHVESTEELGLIGETLKNSGVEWGIVLNYETPLEVFDQIQGECDLVQLMAIKEIGYHGKPFEPSVIPKVAALRVKYPELTISVDGGVTIENALRLKEVGVSGVVVGGALFNAEDPVAALNDFKKALNE